AVLRQRGGGTDRGSSNQGGTQKTRHVVLPRLCACKEILGGRSAAYGISPASIASRAPRASPPPRPPKPPPPPPAAQLARQPTATLIRECLTGSSGGALTIHPRKARSWRKVAVVCRELNRA